MSGWSSTHTASRPTLVVRSKAQQALSDNSSTVHSLSVMAISPFLSRLGTSSRIGIGRNATSPPSSACPPSRSSSGSVADREADEAGAFRPIRGMVPDSVGTPEKETRGLAAMASLWPIGGPPATVERPRTGGPTGTHVAAVTGCKNRRRSAEQSTMRLPALGGPLHGRWRRPVWALLGGLARMPRSVARPALAPDPKRSTLGSV